MVTHVSWYNCVQARNCVGILELKNPVLLQQITFKLLLSKSINNFYWKENIDKRKSLDAESGSRLHRFPAPQAGIDTNHSNSRGAVPWVRKCRVPKYTLMKP